MKHQKDFMKKKRVNGTNNIPGNIILDIANKRAKLEKYYLQEKLDYYNGFGQEYNPNWLDKQMKKIEKMEDYKK